jgi:hypothetical protein
MCHHTASPPSADGDGDASYCAEGDEDAPLSNLLLDRTGLWWVLAAGATNTNGSGVDTWGGGVPENSMNSYAIGIEAGNNGVGEAWPTAQQNAYVAGVKAMMAHYNIPAGHVRAHFEWAPDRKTDPAGQSNWASGSAKWDMNKFRSDCGTGAAPGPTPPPTPTDQEDDVVWRVAKQTEGGAFFIGDGNTSWTVGDSGHDVSFDESLIRMAPGAVNVIRVTWDAATDENAGKTMVTTWGGIKEYMKPGKIKTHVGKHPSLG